MFTLAEHVKSFITSGLRPTQPMSLASVSMSLAAKKTCIWGFLKRFNPNQVVQSQKMARGLKRI